MLTRAEAAAAAREELSYVAAELDDVAYTKGGVSGYSSSNSTERRSEEVIYGDQTFVEPAEEGGELAPEPEPRRGGESFIFRNAPIDAVINEILGRAANR